MNQSSGKPNSWKRLSVRIIVLAILLFCAYWAGDWAGKRRMHQRITAAWNGLFAAPAEADDPFAADPFAGDPFAADPVAGDPFAADPFGEADPFASEPLGEADLLRWRSEELNDRNNRANRGS